MEAEETLKTSLGSDHQYPEILNQCFRCRFPLFFSINSLYTSTCTPCAFSSSSFHSTPPTPQKSRSKASISFGILPFAGLLLVPLHFFFFSPLHFRFISLHASFFPAAFFFFFFFFFFFSSSFFQDVADFESV